MSDATGQAIWRRRGVLAVVALALVVFCAACSPSNRGSGTEEEHVAQVVAAVTEADARVSEVSAETSTSGLSSGWTVDVVLEDAEPVTADELRALLLAIRHAGDRDPGHIDLFTTDPSGESLDLSSAADELGIRHSDVGAGLGVTRDAIDEALGE